MHSERVRNTRSEIRRGGNKNAGADEQVRAADPRGEPPGHALRGHVSRASESSQWGLGGRAIGAPCAPPRPPRVRFVHSSGPERSQGAGGTREDHSARTEMQSYLSQPTGKAGGRARGRACPAQQRLLQ